MASDLSGLGDVQYGDVTLDGPYTRTKLSGKPVWDDSNRVIKWWEYTIHVTTWILNTELFPTTDELLEGLRETLTTPGLELKYSGVGWGEEFIVNSPEDGSSFTDVCFGPKPTLLSYVPHGGTAAFVEWEVTTCVPDQCFVTAKVPPGKVLAVSWDWSHSIAQGGWSTVKWSITAEIPMVLFEGNRITDTADSLRDRLAPPLLAGFERVSDWKLSADKRKLTGTVTDKEIPEPLPDGLTFMRLRHSVRSGASKQQGWFQRWQHTLRGSVHVPRGMTKASAWQRIHLVLGARLALARRATPTVNPPIVPVGGGLGPGGVGPPTPPPAGPVGPFAPVLTPFGWAVPTGAPFVPVAHSNTTHRGVWLKEFSVDDDVFGTEITFSISYEQIGSSLHNILNDSGLWRAIPGCSFASWQQSMALPGKPHDPRGGSKIKYTAAMEGVVIDLCNGNPQGPILPGAGPAAAGAAPPPPQGALAPLVPVIAAVGNFLFPDPAP